MTPLDRARTALEGLSVGDSVGDLVFFHPQLPHERPTLHDLPPAPWKTTDDTQVAACVVAVLMAGRPFTTDDVATCLARHFDADYGSPPEVAHLIGRLRVGDAWEAVAGQADVDGISPAGSGAAARCTPIGAYYAHDMAKALEVARAAARATHTTPDALSGAMALTAAAAIATRWGGSPQPAEWRSFLDAVIRVLPQGNLRTKLATARAMPAETLTREAAKRLGNGSEGPAADAVPFALWCAAQWLDNYSEALWQVTSAGGDTPALGAMVGGVVACYTGLRGIPMHWRRARARLPMWLEPR